MSAGTEQDTRNLTVSPFGIGNVRWFIVFRILFNARFYYPVFTVLFLDYGLSIEQFATLNALWAITIVCAEIPSGAMADLLGRKRLLLLTALTMVIEMGLLAFVPTGNTTLVFWAFCLNRILSGLAEAMASGADEAIAYDSLLEAGLEAQWPDVLGMLMRLQAAAGVIAMSVGALLYDPDALNRVASLAGLNVQLGQQTTMRFPVYLTLLLAIMATIVACRFEERRSQTNLSFATVDEAFRLTMRTADWIVHTPFALAVILLGMLYDHLMRLIITLASQYFRLIALPEMSFGVIMAGFSLIGLVIPRVAQWLVGRFSVSTNYLILALLCIATLWGLIRFDPIWGIIPMAGVMIGLLLTSFLTSHYLNKATPSAQRATTLSFKGMLFNLAYGIIGMLFAGLVGYLRGSLTGDTSGDIEDTAFRLSFLWFPWYGMVLTMIIGGLMFRFLRRPESARPS